MTKRLNSFVTSANSRDTEFPLNNLPYGVFSQGDHTRCGVAIGDFVLDVAALENQGLIDLGQPLLQSAAWNPVMDAGSDIWDQLRALLIALLSEGSADQGAVEAALYPLAEVQLLMPFTVTEFTDFYAGKNHAINVGTMFRGAENALPPNWLHIPIGYNGRASSVVVSGTDIYRPSGQLKGPDDTLPKFAPSKRFDIELEMGAIVGRPSSDRVSVDQADEMIFGYVILNDWSARDIQAWEYQPLGPFQSKATATTISPWIVTKAALEPFRCETPERDFELLPHLKDTGPMLYDIDLSVTIAPKGSDASEVVRTNYKEMYYSAAQQLAHHTSAGCAMRVGDLLGSGTISGATKESRGSFLELSWGGNEPFTLDTGETRSFIEDFDTLTLQGFAQGSDFKIGFGECTGMLLPAK
ncbi:MAG: fumarylacetoacetase [Rhodobacteraceae bacterium]|nr:fumarylacetoacetase [Paracoccaceae bacterium]